LEKPEELAVTCLKGFLAFSVRTLRKSVHSFPAQTVENNYRRHYDLSKEVRE